jgi:DNA-binding NarL/FixJ family response regulator
MNLLICDDHAIFRAGLLSVLEQLPRTVEIEEVPDARSALERVAVGQIDLVLLDLKMPGMDGWSALRSLRASHPAVAVVILSASEDAGDARKALDLGAAGFIPKSTSGDLLRAALEVVFSGGVYVPPQLLEGRSDPAAPANTERALRERAQRLTPRQREVLVLISRGLSNREVGEMLGISAGTVKTHVAALLEILDVSNRTEATLVMSELDLDAEDDS